MMNPNTNRFEKLAVVAPSEATGVPLNQTREKNRRLQKRNLAEEIRQAEVELAREEQRAELAVNRVRQASARLQALRKLLGDR